VIHLTSLSKSLLILSRQFAIYIDLEQKCIKTHEESGGKMCEALVDFFST
jgi:hypothetical protein